MWSVVNTALDVPIPESVPRVCGGLRLPQYNHEAAADLLSLEYNSTPYHVRNCGVVAAHVLELLQRENIPLFNEKVTTISDDMLIQMTERIVGISGAVSNHLSGVLSREQYHAPELTFSIQIKGESLVGTWDNLNKPSFEMVSLVEKAAVTYGHLSAPVAKKLATIMMGELIDGHSTFASFTLKEAHDTQIVLDFNVVSQPRLMQPQNRAA